MAEGGGVLGLVTASEDGSYVYFVAKGVLTSGKNVEGEGGRIVRKTNLEAPRMAGVRRLWRHSARDWWRRVSVFRSRAG